MTTPTIAVKANDLGERCQIGIGNWGYWLANVPAGQTAMRYRPMRANRPSGDYIAPNDFLTMRDDENWSRVFMNDWRGGGRQLSYVVTDVASKKRYFDSTGIDIHEVGRMQMVRAVSANANGTSANTTALPLTAAGTYLYLGDLSKVSYSTAWSGAPTTAATSGAGNVLALENDGQYVYGAVNGVGINRWAIGSGSAGTAWNTTITAGRRLLWANRLVYAIDAASFYQVASGGTATTNFTPPTGWTLQDIDARKGGSINAPIYILGTAGNRSFLWYWDGTTVNDYLPMPTGFVGLRLLYYQGILFIHGYELNPDGSASPVAYYIQSETLGKLGYFGLPQANGNPTPNGVTAAANYGIDAVGTSVYFTVSTTNQDIWVWDIVNGSLSRFIQVVSGTSKTISDVHIYQGGPWVTVLGTGLFATQTTFVTTATLDTSDMNLGQPWLNNNWLSLEVVHSSLLAGEQVAVSYSTDQGTTYTATITDSTLGSARATSVLSTPTTSVANPFLRLRFTLTSGTSQATAPYVISFALRASPVDPVGAIIEAVLACPDAALMPNGGPDWQGGSGQERLYNIVNLYETKGVVSVIYLATAGTRAKNPKTINAEIDDYEIMMPSGVGVGPNKGLEGTVRVVLREVLTT